MDDRAATAPRSSRVRPLAAVLLLLVFGLGGVAWASEVGDMVLVTEPVPSDYYAAGETVDIRAKIDGDAVVAGQSIAVSDVVTGDVMAAGQSVALSGDFRDDLRAAGRTVRLTGQVADHAIATGQTVVFAHDSRVGGFVWTAGNLVEIEGTIGGDLEAAGQTVMITGTVQGDVEVEATKVVIGDNAHIHGDLFWRSRQAPEIHSGALIDGRQVERPARAQAPTGDEIVVGIVGAVIFSAASLLLLTWLLRIAMPPVVAGAARRLRVQPGRSFGIGVLTLVVAPIVAVLALITVIGVPIAIVVMLGYVVLLVISVPVALQSLTDLVLARRGATPPSGGARFGWLALAALVFVAALQIPVVGWLIGLVVVVFGLGALVLRAFRRDPYDGPGTTTTDTTGTTTTGTMASTQTPAATTHSPIITPEPSLGSGPRER